MKRNVSKKLILASIVFFLTGFAMLFSERIKYQDDVAFKKNAICTDAVVTSVYDDSYWTRDKHYKHQYDLGIEFKVDGKKINTTIDNYSSYKSVGEHIEIYYDINDYYNVRAEFSNKWYHKLICLPFFLIGFFTLYSMGIFPTNKKIVQEVEEQL